MTFPMSSYGLWGSLESKMPASEHQLFSAILVLSHISHLAPMTRGSTPDFEHIYRIFVTLFKPLLSFGQFFLILEFCTDRKQAWLRQLTIWESRMETNFDLDSESGFFVLFRNFLTGNHVLELMKMFKWLLKLEFHGCLIDDKLVSFFQILGTKRKDWERARNLQRSGMDDWCVNLIV